VDTTVDRGVVLRLLGQVEEAANRAGWDKDPQLLVLYAWRVGDVEQRYGRMLGRCGPVHRLGGYATRPIRPAGEAENPANELHTMARNLCHAPDHPLTGMVRAILGGDGFLGVGALAEAWQAPPGEGEVHDADGRLRSIAAMPDRVEARILTAVDRYGGEYLVHRVRGQKPTRVVMDREAGGAMVAAMRTITAALAGQPVPDPGAPPLHPDQRVDPRPGG
jgi:hypothetical protein